MDQNAISPEDAAWPAAWRHHSRMQATLAQMRRDGELCDVLLLIEPFRGWIAPPAVGAHRVILAAASPYLCEQLQHCEERAQVVIPIQGVEPAALETVLDYMYNPAALVLDGDNIESVMECATRLQVAAVLDECCAFLAPRLAPRNALRIRALAERNGCEVLADVAASYVYEHFREVAQSDDFMALEADALGALLQRDGIAVCSPLLVLDAVRHWVLPEPAARRLQLAVLLQLVRMQLVPLAELADRIRREPIVSGPKDAVCHVLTLSARLCAHAPNRGAAGGEGAGVAGADVAGAEVAGADVAGEVVACADVAGADVAGAEVAGAE